MCIRDSPTIEVCTPEDFDENFKSGLEHDDKLLSELVSDWNKITSDPKLELFITDYLNGILFDKSINQEGKLVVFSESKETTKYLSETLKGKGFNRILTIYSDNRNDKMPILEANFDANYKGEKKNDYNIVICTEVLAEGVNPVSYTHLDVYKRQIIGLHVKYRKHTITH